MWGTTSHTASPVSLRTALISTSLNAICRSGLIPDRAPSAVGARIWPWCGTQRAGSCALSDGPADRPRRAGASPSEPATPGDRLISMDRNLAWRPRALLVEQAVGNPHTCLAGRGAPVRLAGRNPHQPMATTGCSKDCATMSRTPNVSRVRLNRTHGLKGGWGNEPALRAPRL